VKVREIMTTPVTTLELDDNLAFAEELMIVERVRHLPVLDGDVLMGLLSQRDVLAASTSILRNPSVEQDHEVKRRTSVREIMRGAVDTIGPDDDAVDAADFMLMQKVGCLPVVDERRRLLGIVTESDFVALARDALRSGRIVPRTPVVLASVTQTRPPMKKAPTKIVTKPKKSIVGKKSRAAR